MYKVWYLLFQLPSVLVTINQGNKINLRLSFQSGSVRYCPISVPYIKIHIKRVWTLLRFFYSPYLPPYRRYLVFPYFQLHKVKIMTEIVQPVYKRSRGKIKENLYFFCLSSLHSKVVNKVRIFQNRQYFSLYTLKMNKERIKIQDLITLL